MSVQVHHETAPQDRLSMGQKFSYGLGSIVNNLLGGAIGFSLLPYIGFYSV